MCSVENINSVARQGFVEEIRQLKDLISHDSKNACQTGKKGTDIHTDKMIWRQTGKKQLRDQNDTSISLVMPRAASNTRS